MCVLRAAAGGACRHPATAAAAASDIATQALLLLNSEAGVVCSQLPGLVRWGVCGAPACHAWLLLLLLLLLVQVL
jgi:hypothetical protein